MRFIIERKDDKVLVVDADVAEEKGDRIYFFKLKPNHSAMMQEQFYPIEKVLVAPIGEYKCFYVENKSDK